LYNIIIEQNYSSDLGRVLCSQSSGS